MPPPPAPAALTAESDRPHPDPNPSRRRRRGAFGRAAILAILAGLTAWNATRPAHLPRAEVASARGHHVAALRGALDHLQRRPWSARAARLAGLSLSALDYPGPAEGYYRRAGALDRDASHVRALALVRSNRGPEAEAVYEAILARWPDDPTALRRLAVVYMTRHDTGKSLALARRLADSPDRPAAVVGLTMVATVNHNIRDYERAASSAARVLELDPELRSMPLPRRQFRTQYAFDLVQLGQGEAAQEQILRAMAESGEDAELSDLLAQSYHQRGRLDDAERAYRRALEHDPSFTPSLVGLGRALLAAGRAGEAAEALTQAVRREPNNYAALYSLGLAHNRLGHAEEARRLRRRLDELKQRQGAPVTGMGGPEPHPPS